MSKIHISETRSLSGSSLFSWRCLQLDRLYPRPERLRRHQTLHLHDLQFVAPLLCLRTTYAESAIITISYPSRQLGNRFRGISMVRVRLENTRRWYRSTLKWNTVQVWEQPFRHGGVVYIYSLYVSLLRRCIEIVEKKYREKLEKSAIQTETRRRKVNRVRYTSIHK